VEKALKTRRPEKMSTYAPSMEEKIAGSAQKKKRGTAIHRVLSRGGGKGGDREEKSTRKSHEGRARGKGECNREWWEKALRGKRNGRAIKSRE